MAQIVRRYQKIAWITVGAILFLILVGGLVRMTGSGMGCPDWPKCFGQWVPPTDISQLPADYKVRFAVAGKEIADFEATKTWIEYLNRLLGVIIGFLGILTVLFALPLRRTLPSVFRWSLAGLVLVILQGGLGAYVVRTDLQVGTITLHMFMALIVLTAFIGGALLSYPERWKKMGNHMPAIDTKSLSLAALVLVVILAQLLLGTQVREGVDEVAKAFGEAERENWLSHLGISYTYHKFFYYAVVLVMGVVGWQLKAVWESSTLLKNLGLLSIAIVGTEILMGLGMHHLGLPKILQPLHLLLASMLFASVVTMVMALWRIKKNQSAPEKRMRGELALENK
ncbi:MAG: COX15/CtaA family protein [Bacteroidota bacterium]